MKYSLLANNLGCICVMREFYETEKIYLDFSCSSLILCLVQHILLIEKGKQYINFFEIENFDNFLLEG